MAIIVSSNTYERFVVDPDDIEPFFTYEGKEITPDEAADIAVKVNEVSKTNPLVEKLEIAQRIKPEARRITVTYRPLRAADKTAIEDTAQMLYGEAQGMAPPGTMRRLAVKKGVVKWDFDVPFTDNVLDNLDAALFEQLYAWLSWGTEPLEQDPVTGLPLDNPTVKVELAEEETEDETPPGGTATKVKSRARPASSD